MSGNQLKLIALILMTIDHIHNFVPNMPIYFSYLGRMAYPIFAFCCVQSYFYTRNVKKYLVRLYIANVITSFVFYAVNLRYGENDLFGRNIVNNIFTTLFQMVLLVYVIDTVIHKTCGYRKFFISYGIYQMLLYIVVEWIASSDSVPLFETYLLSHLFCNLWHTEGSRFYIFLGVIFYFGYREPKGSKKKIAIFYVIYCIGYFFIYYGNILQWIFLRIALYISPQVRDIAVKATSYVLQLDEVWCNRWKEYSLFGNDCAWMMVFAVLFLLLYNGKKGKNMKWLFYIYYPAHIIILFLAGSYL